MQPPLVSVIINCFNGAKFLRQALDSVLAQTHANFEVVFWDNQSTDSSADIFHSYSDDRLRYFHAPKHTLLYEARNLAVGESRGEFIAFLDTDDWWEPTKLEKQLALFGDDEVGLVYGDYWLENERKGSRSRACGANLRRGYVLDALLEKSPVGLLTILVRRRALLSLPYAFNPGYHIIGDFDFLARLAVNWKFDYVADAVAHYRWHGGNESLLPSGRSRLSSELDDWVRTMRSHPQIVASSNFKCLEDRAICERGFLFLANGQYGAALAEAAKLPMGRHALRLLAAIVLPARMVDWLRA